jgi:type I restriction enzyme S subunit
MLPKGWSLKKLEELASVERGKFSVRPRNDPRYFGGNIPFVQTGDIAAAKTYLRSYTQTLNEDGLAVSRSFPKNTILITIAANIGDTAITTFDVACPDSLVAIQPKKDIDIFWLNSYLETCKDELDGKATQNAQKNINLQVLKPLEIVTPPPKEQRKIAQILSTWGKAIATTEKLIAASQQQKKALMQQLLTGKKRFAGFSEKWEEVKLEDVCYINPKKPNEPENGLVSFIPMDAVSEEAKLIRTEIRAYSDVSKGFTSFKDKDILVAKITPCFENGKGAKVSNLINGIGFGSTEFHVLRAKKNISSQFIYYISNTKEFRDRGAMSMQGSAGHKRVTTDYIQVYKFLLPASYQEQQKIAAVLTAADQEINALQSKLAHFQQEKKALMQQLLTGKRRVVLEAETSL